MEKPLESERLLSGFPRQLFASFDGSSRDFFFRHGDPRRQHFDAHGGAELGNRSFGSFLGAAIISACEHRPVRRLFYINRRLLRQERDLWGFKGASIPFGQGREQNSAREVASFIDRASTRVR